MSSGRAFRFGARQISSKKRLPDQHYGGIGRLRGNRETELSAHLQHRLVLTEDLADQFTDSALPGDVDEPLHKQITEPAPFPIAADGNGILGTQFVGIGKEVRHAQRRSVAFGEKRHFAVVVEVRQACGDDVS